MPYREFLSRFGSNDYFYVLAAFRLGSPQILICGESGGNSRTYDLAERYRVLRSICRTRRGLERPARAPRGERGSRPERRGPRPATGCDIRLRFLGFQKNIVCLHPRLAA